MSKTVLPPHEATMTGCRVTQTVLELFDRTLYFLFYTKEKTTAMFINVQLVFESHFLKINSLHIFLIAITNKICFILSKTNKKILII